MKYIECFASGMSPIQYWGRLTGGGRLSHFRKKNQAQAHTGLGTGKGYPRTARGWLKGADRGGIFWSNCRKFDISATKKKEGKA